MGCDTQWLPIDRWEGTNLCQRHDVCNVKRNNTVNIEKKDCFREEKYPTGRREISRFTVFDPNEDIANALLQIN